ncbi:unnamed protein product, partial [Pylaiella littoralis]
ASDIETDFLLINWDAGRDNTGISWSSDGSMHGNACASKGIAVTGMDWKEGTGPGLTFADPETNSVDHYTSRGPCIVDDEVRNKPTTCAAT